MRFRRIPLVLMTCTLAAASHPKIDRSEHDRLAQQAKSITVIRDDWGVAHIHGNTDADAVFGMVYAQAEDDFHRIEMNYLNALGRVAEAEGATKIYQDLRMRLFIDPITLQQRYAASPAWLRALMDAFADGLNYYLLKHPETKPLVITRFEPWMALSFTEGSIGGDIERIDVRALEEFYGKGPTTSPLESSEEAEASEPSGSNGIAIAPRNTAGKHALLLINPHTSFFFRSELQMSSDEGMNAYGAVTWGQFFIYQGLNAHAGWMHTSSGVDAVDEYAESVRKEGDGYFYRYGSSQKPVAEKQITIRYKSSGGLLAERSFTTYRTQHGPVIRREDGKWISIRLMQEPVKALEQSYLRTKATTYQQYAKTMEFQANSSNNTIFADDAGDIAYWHGNFIPRRDNRFDWTKPVDGSDPRTEWQGLLTVNEGPRLLNPSSGWLYNANNWPWSGAGSSSLRAADFPAYVETGTESPRGLHAIRLLTNARDFTPESLMKAAYDSYLPWFEKPIPALVRAWDALPQTDRRKEQLARQIATLRHWDLRWSVDSVATALAVFWAEDLRGRVQQAAKQARLPAEEFIAARLSNDELLAALGRAAEKMTADFGSWQTQWGEINRFQRINGDIVQPFSDSAPSLPVGFTSSSWGSLASFGAKAYPGTKKWYGTSGNSFVAVVEFGPQVKALAVTAGGECGHPQSRHFNDQAERYATGQLRRVYFYPSDVRGHVERQYHPGE